jgi:hypothetical protein
MPPADRSSSAGSAMPTRARSPGPGVWNVDLAAMKDFRLSTQVRFTFNVFITNLFNHADWGRPDTNVTSANYGKITSLNSDFPLRRVVLGGRLTF